MKMEVDHILPWSKGGSDELYNLQPLCKPCNRSKSAGSAGWDNVKTVKNRIIHGEFIKAPIKKAFRQNKLLKALGVNKRK